MGPDGSVVSPMKIRHYRFPLPFCRSCFMTWEYPNCHLILFWSEKIILFNKIIFYFVEACTMHYRYISEVQSETLKCQISFQNVFPKGMPQCSVWMWSDYLHDKVSSFRFGLSLFTLHISCSFATGFYLRVSGIWTGSFEVMFSPACSKFAVCGFFPWLIPSCR